MRSKTPYKKRLYALIGGILLLCFFVSIAGVTMLNERGIQRDMKTHLQKLERNSKKKLNTIASSYLPDKESTYAAALEMSQLYDTVQQQGVQLSYRCFEKKKNVLKSGNLVFLHYYDSFRDEDGDVVYEEIQQIILQLDAYLSKEEIAKIRKIYETNKDSVIVAEGRIKGIFLIPEQIQVVIPASSHKGKSWKSKNTILSEQNTREYRLLYEKNINSGEKGTKKTPSSVTLSSEAYFEKQSMQVVSKQKNVTEKRKNRFEVVYCGTIKTGTNTSLSYYFFGNPLKISIQQLWLIYIVLIVFYVVAAGIVYSLMHLIFSKQEKWNWNQKMLTRAIAHELKTPISIIQGYCEGFQYQKDTQRQQEYLETIASETTEMNQLVLDMLEVSKLETEGYELDREEIQLVEFVQAVVKQYKALYMEKDITVQVEGKENCFINGDLTCIHKVVSNLFGNAIKHAPEHGLVKITIQEEKEWVYLRIYNNGPTIPEHIREHIWDGYQQVQKTNKSRIRSTGLGLTIVKYMLDLHKYKYGCVNKEIGVEFWVKMKRIHMQ